MTWASHRKEQARVTADVQTLTVRCLHCRWSFRGKHQDGRRAFKQHRELKHTQQPGGPA